MKVIHWQCLRISLLSNSEIDSATDVAVLVSFIGWDLVGRNGNSYFGSNEWLDVNHEFGVGVIALHLASSYDFTILVGLPVTIKIVNLDALEDDISPVIVLLFEVDLGENDLVNLGRFLHLDFDPEILLFGSCLFGVVETGLGVKSGFVPVTAPLGLGLPGGTQIQDGIKAVMVILLAVLVGLGFFLGDLGIKSVLFASLGWFGLVGWVAVAIIFEIERFAFVVLIAPLFAFVKTGSLDLDNVVTWDAHLFFFSVDDFIMILLLFLLFFLGITSLENQLDISS